MSRRGRAAFTMSRSGSLGLTEAFSWSDASWKICMIKRTTACITKMILPREDAIGFMQLVPLKVTR